jgi:hypothetical protein
MNLTPALAFGSIVGIMIGMLEKNWFFILGFGILLSNCVYSAKVAGGRDENS